ncbi:hypothetical protein TPHA_0E03430 [Tetrapisispora phaffii CBS 4417]|uniref:Uncharacterized protein n=1 Tax=Tetrapisispora phaffii (strain ATCC 24235 / CBS 4417 / NBRC 1672 / NRRL Y-8282 / UCD 70-5) TaxID=1071381 RepID=G8BU55_TETPH|nr:hypothetical protein TPHA_0E03430 [Tetrapisispora phaffii CBS 4417]CCE63433.1 hypothetical protein TPHA_0E03430 [Tetrapisispora phaffii CBS 4417]
MKPKSNLKYTGKEGSSWQGEITNLLSSETITTYSGGFNKKLSVRIASLITGSLFLFYILSSMFSGNGSGDSLELRKEKLPEKHGFYYHEIEASSPLIFPNVDHTKVLKDIGVRGLYILRMGPNDNNHYYIKVDDKPVPEEVIKKTTDQAFLAKRSFLDHGKLVYHKGNSPDVIIVTLIDFDKYDEATLVKIVQNRVDYGQKHNYGVYIRWIQEFVPVLEKQDLKSQYDNIKPIMMRAAMHAFPNAKQYMYLDDEALFMDMNLSLQKHILDPSVIEMSLLKGVPVTAGSNINTYQNFHASNAKVIVPQGPDGKLDLSAFIVSNTFSGKVFLEYLCEPLVRNYSFESFEHAVAHILQWHAYLLSKTAVVVPKLFASIYDPENKALNDVYHYTEGDLLISFKGCEARGTCAQEISLFADKAKK